MGLFSRKEKNAAVEAEVAEIKTGPFDEADAPIAQRIDFGGLQVPLKAEAKVSIERDANTNQLVGLNVQFQESNIQIHAFAAPKSGGLWESIQAGIKETIADQKGISEVKEGVFGSELHARVPLPPAANGARRYAPMRFIGVDGPRWMLRAVITGAALVKPEVAKEVEEYLRQVVVVRGKSAMAPREVILLRVVADQNVPVKRKMQMDLRVPTDTTAEVR